MSSPERMSWQRPSGATGPTEVTGAAVLEECPQTCPCIPQAPGELQAGNVGPGAASLGMQPVGLRGCQGVRTLSPIMKEWLLLCGAGAAGGTEPPQAQPNAEYP